jgi:hypothetical protein
LSQGHAKGRKAPLCRAFRCAEEDSNLHPVSLDQALNLVTRVSYPSYASISSRSSSRVDDMDAMDDLDVATDVATSDGHHAAERDVYVTRALSGHEVAKSPHARIRRAKRQRSHERTRRLDLGA